MNSLFPQDNLSELPIQSLIGERIDNTSLDILRLDLLDTLSSGNKWFKLKYNILEAKKQGKTGILTFGGAYSNHLSAVAKICSDLSMNSIGIVRGEKVEPLNITLSECEKNGMELHFLSRELYRIKKHAECEAKIKEEYNNYLFVPEGGSNSEGVMGAEEIVKFIPKNKYQYVCVPFGSGGTIAGIIRANRNFKVLGFSSLKGAQYMEEVIRGLADSKNTKWRLVYDYHFGGFAKTDHTLFEFMKEFNEQYDIKLDPIYNAKMMYGVIDLVRSGHFRPDSRVLAINTGGLQGLRGFEDRFHY